MATLTEAKIAELKAAHGDLQCVVTPMGELAFKRPSRMAYDKWADSGARGGSRSEAARELAQNCLVFPDWTEFVATLERYPGILTGEVSTACTADTGLTEKYEVKKL